MMTKSLDEAYECLVSFENDLVEAYNDDIIDIED